MRDKIKVDYDELERLFADRENCCEAGVTSRPEEDSDEATLLLKRGKCSQTSCSRSEDIGVFTS